MSRNHVMSTSSRELDSSIRKSKLALEQDRESRLLTKRTPYVVEIEAGSTPLQLAPGSITHVFARRSSGFIAAVQSGDLSQMDTSTDQFKTPQIRATEFTKHCSTLVGSPTYFDVSYCGREIAKFASFDPKFGIGHYCVPWGGEQLDDSKFDVVECAKPDCEMTDPVEHLIIKCPPMLTPLESEAQATLSDRRGMFFSGTFAPVALPVTLTMTMTVTGTGTGGGGVHTNAKHIDMPTTQKSKRVRSLGKAASFRELAALRREMQSAS